MEHPRRDRDGPVVGVPPISLYVVGSFFGDERGRDQIAMNAFAAQVAADHEAARAGFIHQPKFQFRPGEFLDEFIDGIERSANDAVAAYFSGVLWRDGDGDGVLVDIQTDIMHDFIHGCLVSLHGY